ncbi:MAG: hypothetical protein M1833_002925 [Piccolia ochrophora]|nr:MAG: hypothetical protein M1833_002925 [Piccolia ochrophora]
MDPASVGFGAFRTVVQLAQFGLRLRDVDEDTRIFLRLIERVDKDLQEAQRLRHEKESLLVNDAQKLWIDHTISDAKEALHRIGSLLESGRVDISTGGAVSLKHKLDWMMLHHEKFVARESYLSGCHAAIHAIIGVMSGMKSLESPPPPAYHASILPPEPERPQSAARLKPPSLRRPKSRTFRSDEPTPAISEFPPKEVDSKSLQFTHEKSKYQRGSGPWTASSPSECEQHTSPSKLEVVMPGVQHSTIYYDPNPSKSGEWCLLRSGDDAVQEDEKPLAQGKSLLATRHERRREHEQRRRRGQECATTYNTCG